MLGVWLLHGRTGVLLQLGRAWTGLARFIVVRTLNGFEEFMGSRGIVVLSPLTAPEEFIVFAGIVGTNGRAVPRQSSADV